MSCLVVIYLFLCVIDRAAPWRTLTLLRMSNQRRTLTLLRMANPESDEIPKLPKVGSPMPETRPNWFHVPAPGGSKTKFQELKESIKGLGLHTVCEEAKCPNIGNLSFISFSFFFLLFPSFR
jgi:hypothetical protein